MSQTVTNNGNWSGEVWQEFLRASIQKAESFDKNILAVQTGFNEALFYPKIDLTGNILQDYSGTGVDDGAVGTFAANASTALTLQELSVKIANIDPNDWRDFWSSLGLSADVMWTWPSLPPKVQQAYLMELLESLDWIHEQNIWTGERTSGDLTSENRYNGFITQLEAAADFVDATPSGATAFTANNVFDACDDVVDTLYSNATMKAVESRRNAELTMFVSKKTARLMIQAEQDTDGKGETRLTSQGIYDMIYSGALPVLPLSAFPDDKILVTYASSQPRRSNLHFGMSNIRNKTNVQIFNMANGSNFLGMRMDMAVGVKIPFTTECLYYNVP
jgi:hypothetical protein